MATEVNQALKRSKLDRTYLLLAIALELEIQATLDQLADEVDAATAAQGTANGIKDETTLVDTLLALYVAWAVLMRFTVQTSAVKIAAAKVETELARTVPLLNKVGATRAASEFASEIKSYPQEFAKRFPNIKTGVHELSFSDRMDALEISGEKTIRNIVALGVTQGKSAEAIASDLRGYLNPAAGSSKAKPYTIFRARFGNPSSYQPKDVLPGTVQTNAISIARTESATAYRRATTEFYRDKSYTLGFEWVLSNTHAGNDVCDDLAHAEYGADATEPFSHPYCVCDWIVRTRPISVLRDMVAQGDLS